MLSVAWPELDSQFSAEKTKNTDTNTHEQTDTQTHATWLSQTSTEFLRRTKLSFPALHGSEALVKVSLCLSYLSVKHYSNCTHSQGSLCEGNKIIHIKCLGLSQVPISDRQMLLIILFTVFCTYYPVPSQDLFG